ncbi:Smr/MutS family protein [Meridianimarinicoccus aquatilis]|uniref:DNA mismatch repair protein MutS n=1 Tax=Meridianimarinicoccus aquatilis TaxID=2552766 RepID=A0A4R6AZJ1_9RHOB|nr:Smr/MutS family protein [Fluviibacterium aquatile]TDL89302.1 DNA mismatch repair protein MutS [Fluviibacterium aquatile]
MSRKRHKPGQSPEDHDIWARVVESVTPLTNASLSKAAHLRGSAQERPHSEKPEAPAPKRMAAKKLSSFRLGSRAQTPPPRHDLAPNITDALHAAPPRVDGHTHGRLKRGKLRPEARIDLHGMTLAQAHPVLVRFLMSAYSDGKRLVLVITGKGKDRDEGGVIPVRRGILRHQVPHWAQTPPLSQVVLQITPAHYRHGGDGAYYVYLRKAR